MRAAVEQATVTDTPERLAALRQAESDLKDAGAIAQLELREDTSPSVLVRFVRPQDGSI